MVKWFVVTILVQVQPGGPPSLAQLQRHMMGSQAAPAPGPAPEPSSPPVPRPAKSASQNTLSSRNLELHDGAGAGAGSGLDLDQTTMIGSALDLDSLEGDRGEVGLGAEPAASQAGSQIGLLKVHGSNID